MMAGLERALLFTLEPFHLVINEVLAEARNLMVIMLIPKIVRHLFRWRPRSECAADCGVPPEAREGFVIIEAMLDRSLGDLFDARRDVGVGSLQPATGALEEIVALPA